MINERTKHLIEENFDFFIFKYKTITKDELEISSIRQEMDYVAIKLRSEKIKNIKNKIENQTLKNKVEKKSKKVHFFSNFLEKMV